MLSYIHHHHIILTIEDVYFLTPAAKWPVQATGRSNLRLPPAPCKVVMLTISTMGMVMTMISMMGMVMTMSMIRMTAESHQNMHVLQLVAGKRFHEANNRKNITNITNISGTILLALSPLSLSVQNQCTGRFYLLHFTRQRLMALCDSLMYRLSKLFVIHVSTHFIFYTFLK